MIIKLAPNKMHFKVLPERITEMGNTTFHRLSARSIWSIPVPSDVYFMLHRYGIEVKSTPVYYSNGKPTGVVDRPELIMYRMEMFR